MVKLLHAKVNIRTSRDFLLKDSRLAPYIERLKAPVLRRTHGAFKDLLESIIYQQLSGKAAKTIAERFFALFPEGAPTPFDVHEMSPLKLRSVGLSEQKVSYVLDLAEKFINGTIAPKQFSKLGDNEIADHLLKVKGIGPWTADMFLIFSLNRANVLPVGDLGIKKGFQIAFGLRELPSEARMKKIARAYEGHLTVLSLYLWRIADEAKGTSDGRSANQ